VEGAPDRNPRQQCGGGGRLALFEAERGPQEQRERDEFYGGVPHPGGEQAVEDHEAHDDQGGQQQGGLEGPPTIPAQTCFPAPE
jgi:hypothetical protein